jgi:hypothetical protein
MVKAIPEDTFLKIIEERYAPADAGGGGGLFRRDNVSDSG